MPEVEGSARMARKHGNGEGSIRQRLDGLWEARVSLPDGRRRSIYGKTRADVSAKLTATTRDRDQGLPIVTDAQTVEAYFTHWLATIQPTVKPRTYVRYAGEIRSHLVPAMGRVKLAKVTPQHLERLYADLLQRGLAPASVAHLHAVVHKALTTAHRQHLVPQNVADLVTAPSARKHRREMQVLSAEQANVLLVAARGDRLEALYVLALSTGARLGELLALRWGDVDFGSGVLEIAHSLHYDAGGAWALTSPKTAKGKRRIELTEGALRALKQHERRQKAERLAAGPAWQDHRFIFTRATGEPLRGTHILERQFRPLLQRAGLPPVRFHDLRHTAASLLLADGVHVLVVSQLLGHSDISMTLGVYAHLNPTMQRTARTSMERLLVGGAHD
jgi:integrase